MAELTRRGLLGGLLGAWGCASLGHRDPVVALHADTRAADFRMQPGQLGLFQVGHSTHLLCLGARRVLTDPWFADPADLVFRHQFDLGVAPEDVGPLDLIAITHDHGDHFDLASLDRVDKSAAVLVATDDMRASLRQIGFREVDVLRPWERAEVHGVSVTTTPAVHWGYEVNYVLSECGGGPRVFFGGDTAWHEGLHRIAEECAPALALLPVDGTHFGPRGRQVVMNPEDAVRAARVLGVEAVVPTHCQDVIPSGLGRWLFPRAAHAPARFLSLCARELPHVDARFLLPGDRFLLGA